MVLSFGHTPNRGRNGLTAFRRNSYGRLHRSYGNRHSVCIVHHLLDDKARQGMDEKKQHVVKKHACFSAPFPQKQILNIKQLIEQQRGKSLGGN